MCVSPSCPLALSLLVTVGAGRLVKHEESLASVNDDDVVAVCAVASENDPVQSGSTV